MRASAASPDRKVPLQVVVSVVVNGANAGVVGRGRPSGVGNAPGELVLETSSAYSTAAEAWEYEVPPTPFANNVRHFALPRALQAALRSSTTPATSTFNLTAMVPTPKHGVYHMTARVRWLPTADAFIDVPANAEAGVGSDGSQVPATRLLHPSHLLQQHMTGGLSLSNTASSFVHVTTSGHASHAWLRSLEDKQVVKQLGKAGRVAAELEELNAKRQDLATRYVALNEELWDMDLSWMLDPKLVEAVESGSRAAMASLLHREAASGVWTLDVFSPVGWSKGGSATFPTLGTLRFLTPQHLFPLSPHTHTQSFCERLLEELDFANTQTLLNFSRPNTMNNYGIVLEELGLSQLLDELMHKYLAPLADLVFPEWGGASLDHHHSFTIRYRHGEDLDLAQHMDASDVSAPSTTSLQRTLPALLTSVTIIHCASS